MSRCAGSLCFMISPVSDCSRRSLEHMKTSRISAIDTSGRMYLMAVCLDSIVHHFSLKLRSVNTHIRS